MKTLSIKPHAPSRIQWVYLKNLEPSKHNIRLFVEKESLTSLIQAYKDYKDGNTSTLPPPPVVQWHGTGEPLEILAGERRVTAASMAGLDMVGVIVVNWSKREAYEYIIKANDFEPITTIEKAYKAYEMEKEGFSPEEISELLGDVSVNRYITVGSLLDPDMFTDSPKLCDPPITWWHEAALYGKAHFEYCFERWNSGLWDEAECKKKFRKRGQELPLDNKQKGLRLSVDKTGRRLLIIGEIRLDLYTDEEVREVVNQFCTDLQTTARKGIDQRHLHGFGDRSVKNYNPDTI